MRMRVVAVLLVASLLALASAAPLRFPDAKKFPLGGSPRPVEHSNVSICEGHYDYRGSACSVSCGGGVRVGRYVVSGDAPNGTCGSPAAAVQVRPCNALSCEMASQGEGMVPMLTARGAVSDVEISDDWNERLKILTTCLAEEIPFVGGMISMILQLFWPSGQQSIWEQIQDQVQDLVDTAILKYELQERKADLSGLQRSLKQYNSAKTNEKGDFMAAMLAIANGIFEKLTGSSNAEHLLPLSVTMAHLHLGILRERYSHGVEIFGEDNTKVWLEELTTQYTEYRDHFKDTYPKWKEWRANKIIARWELRHSPYEIFCWGSCKDRLTDSYVWFEKGRCNWKDTFKDFAMVVKMKMERDAVAEMVNETMIAGMLTHTYVPGESMYVPPDIETFRLGPYSVSTLGMVWSDFTIHEYDTSGRVTKVSIREGAVIESMQLTYADHVGTDVGNIHGGDLREIPVPPGKALNGFRLGFGKTTKVLSWAEVAMGNTSTRRLGNGNHEETQAVNAVMDPAYQVDQWLWKLDESSHILAMEVQFYATAKMTKRASA